MKKNNGVLVSLMVICIVIIGYLVVPPWLADFSVKTKPVPSLVNLTHELRGTGILIPQFGPAENDPYAYTSVQEYNLVRSRQKGKWDGYYIRITPTRLSDSNFHELLVSVQTTEDFTDRALEWDEQDVTPYVGSSPNYPPGRYYKIIGRFQKGPVYYEVSGQLRGPLDEASRAAATAELQVLIEEMDPGTASARVSP